MMDCVVAAISGGFRGGMGGMHSWMHPPTSLKVTILAEKSALILNNSAPFRDASPHRPKRNESGRKLSLNFGEDFFLETTWFWAKKTFEFPIAAEKSVSILVKTFFFFFFGDHLILGKKNVWISDFGQKITLNFGEDIRIFEVLASNPPPPKFSGSATGSYIGM